MQMLEEKKEEDDVQIPDNVVLLLCSSPSTLDPLGAKTTVNLRKCPTWVDLRLSSYDMQVSFLRREGLYQPVWAAANRSPALQAVLRDATWTETLY